MTLVLECLPDFYGPEITLDAVAEGSAAETARVLQLGGADAAIEGDYPGRVRIVVEDDQGVRRSGLSTLEHYIKLLAAG